MRINKKNFSTKTKFVFSMTFLSLPMLINRNVFSKTCMICNFFQFQIGLLTAVAGTADAISSYFSCKLASWVGREIPMAIGFCLDIANYMIYLFWIPTDSSLWVVYILFVMIGLVDGVWQPLVNGKKQVVFAIPQHFFS